MNLLFLGAGKRLSLLETFQVAAQREDVDLRIYAAELDCTVPVAAVATVIRAPSFESRTFARALRDMVARYNVTAIIPCMDTATVALSRIRTDAEHIVSTHDLCVTMHDKRAADGWFCGRGIPVPDGGPPWIAKSRFGYGSRDQFIIHDSDALASLDGYFVQPLALGPEYTVDAYVADGRVLGCLSRRRVKVLDGEVDESVTERHAEVLSLARRILAVPGWDGPITLQFIAGETTCAIEINPRFGGGVTHSIHCGLDMPRWIIRRLLGRPVEPFDDWADGSRMVRCRRDVFFDAVR